MTSKSQKKKATNSALWSAFERLKNGNPNIISGKYKINPTSVQKEADRPYGTIAYHPDVEKAVKDYMQKKKAKEIGVANNEELLIQKIASLKIKLKQEKRKCKEYRIERNKQKTALKREQETSLDIFSSLVELIPNEQRKNVVKIISGNQRNIK